MPATVLPAEIEKFRGGKGYPASVPALASAPPVKGIDLEHVQQMVVYRPETAEYLYTRYTPTKPAYRPGSRPKLEAIAKAVTAGYSSDWEKAQALLGWVNAHLMHPMGRVEASPPDRAATEEVLIESGWAWCNEQSRVYVALAQTVGLAARMCFIWHATLPCGHAPAETFLDGAWAFTDATYNTMIREPGGHVFSGGELHSLDRAKRAADDQYRRAQIQQIERWAKTNPVNASAAKTGTRLDSAWFGHVSLSNYII